jgi:N4-(beta-N-acetylglucosaminyl)-L-asparaginase
MHNRRQFLKTATLATAALSIARRAFPQRGQRAGSRRAIVLSTWNFGITANAEAWKTIGSGGRALDAVENGVKTAEADPHGLSVGLAGLPDREGITTLDACIMDELGNCGSVAALEKIKHPISVARKVMETTPHVMLVGAGAQQFALQNGFPLDEYKNPEAEKAWREWLKTSQYQPVINIENKNKYDPFPGGPYNHDTIGMIAMDKSSNLAGACTTSGMAFKLRGRVGDSPIIGAGLFVDNEIGAATSTGVGEEVIRICGTHLVVELMRQGLHPEAACKKAVERIVKNKGDKAKSIQVGFIAINKFGEYGGFALQKGFQFAVCTGATRNFLVDAKHYF